MAEKDLLLNYNHDLTIKDFDLCLTRDKQIMRQRIMQALLAFKGDWFLNVELGMPYYQEILGQKHSIETARAIFTAEIKKIDGVKELSELNIQLDDETRGLIVEFTVIDSGNNQINITI